MKSSLCIAAMLLAAATLRTSRAAPEGPLQRSVASPGTAPQRPVSTTPGSRYSSSKQVLTGRNFRLKGAFYPPSHPMSPHAGRALAGRVVQTSNGPRFHLISGDHILMEWVPPEPSRGPSFPKAQMLVDYGVPYGMYGGFAWQPIYSPVGDMTFAGVYVDQRTDPETLYVISSTYYNNNFRESEVNLLVARRTADGKWAPRGMYRTSRPSDQGGFGTRFGSGMTAIPDDFSYPVFGERRLGIGFGGAYWQGIIANNVSIGPAFFAMAPQDGSVPHHGYINGAFSPILWHPWNTNAYTVPQIARRPSQAQALNKVLGPNHPSGDPWLPKRGQGVLVDVGRVCRWSVARLPDLGLHGLVVISTNFEGSAHASVVSAQPTPGAGNRTWDITVRMNDGMFTKA